jgi:hypothetical protein
LQPEADPQVRTAVVDPAQDGIDETRLGQPPHRRSGRANAGNNKSVRALELVGVPHEPHPGADTRQRLLDADEIAGAVVDDGDRRARQRRRRHSAVPFVDATPTRRGSISHAWRSARPRALKLASAR